ncbi:MAG: hypothetical protein D8B50_02480 [Prevotella sp.]|nr:MAG: hypothetical protein D8B50_02480 [Prevotella sp.]
MFLKNNFFSRKRAPSCAPIGTMLLARKRCYCMREVLHSSPMQGVLMDDVMQGGLWATCTSLPKRAGFG